MKINLEKSGIIMWKDKNQKRKAIEKEHIEGIPVVSQYKYIGIIFDHKLSFIQHLEYIKEKINKSIKMINIMIW